jgi:O-methyltransferase
MPFKDTIQRTANTLGFRISRAGPSGKPYSNANFKDILHQEIIPIATYCPWLSDRAFLDIYAKVRKNTLVDIYRCYELWTIAKQLNIDGCVLEVGVWRGGTGALITSAVKSSGLDRKIFLADTFEGVVKAGANDTNYKGGEHSDTSKDAVLSLLNSMALKNVEVLKGVFPDDTGHQIKENIALLHCDVDVYESTRDVIEWALPRMLKGALIVFDDYGFSGCEGVTRYVNELRIGNRFLFLYNLNGHAVCIKH